VTASKQKSIHQIENVSEQTNTEKNNANNGHPFDTNVFISIRDKFATIMKTNQETTTLTAAIRESMSEREKMEWWQKREAANQLLQELLDHDMEMSLLGPWKVFFLGDKLFIVDNVKKEFVFFRFFC
jgi:hypothetical protein